MITSSPGDTPAVMQRRWSPAVPLETAAAYGAPTSSAKARSKRSIVGPSESRPERSTSATSCSSRSSSHGLESPIVRTDATRYAADGDISTASSQWLQRSLRPCTVSRYAACNSRVTGPTPISRSSTERTGATSVAVPDHEYLVREVEVGTDEQRLLDAVSEILGDLDDRVACDSGQDRHGQRRRVEDTVPDDEDVLAGPVGDVAVVGQHDRLVVAGPPRFHRRQHRVQVDPGRLGGVRDHVRPYPLPARDLRLDPLRLARLAEVRTPGKADDHDVHRVPRRCNPELAVPVEGDRAHVTRRQPVDGDDLVGRRSDLLDRVREVHVEHLRRVREAYEMVGEAKYRRPRRCVVAANPFEYAGAVVEPVRGNVDLRVRPVDELAVHPDLLGLLHRAQLSFSLDES